MTSASSGDQALALVEAAQALLRRDRGQDVSLALAERLTDDDRRNRVFRCAVSDGGQALPATLIVKQVVAEGYSADASDSWDTQRFFRDWIGAQFLSAVAPEAPHSPRFYGGDPALGFFLLEDLGEHHSLVEPLLGADATAAEAALLAFAARLGSVHAATIGQAARFESIVAAVNPALAVDVRAECRRQGRELQEQAAQLRATIEQLGVVVDGRFAADAAAIGAAFAEPGDFLAYVHGDPCPDNVFYTAGRLRLIDFEFGHYGHALRDAAYARMSFPTCWCANEVPQALVERMEQLHRAALADVCPSARDDGAYQEAMTRMYGAWLIGTLGWQLEGALREDGEWGIATVRSRILTRLQTFVAAAGNRLPGLGATAAALAAHLADRWPATAALPLYPAFRG